MAAAARQLVAERQTLGCAEALQLESEKQRDWFFWRQKRGVVVAGRMSAAEGKKVAEWAQTLGWPLIGDVLSQTGQPLPCADLWLGNGKAVSELAQAQIVVQLGSSLTGKRVLQWQATCEPDEYWLVDNLPGRLDPAQHRGRRLLSSVERWLELHPAEKRQPWATVIPQLAGQAWQAAVASNEPFGEAQLAQRIRGYLPEQGQLFVGNSLGGAPDRRPGAATGRVSGLQQPRRQRHRWPDRHCGRRAARQRPTDAGHRWRSLRALRSQLAGPAAPGASAPLVLIVVNNNGGQIFSMLPTPQDERRQFYLMPQDVDFSHAAAMFGPGLSSP